MKRKEGKNKGGRPTKFDPKYCDQLLEFFDLEPYQKMVTESKKDYFASGDIKSEFEKIKLIPNKMPTLFRFSRKIKVAYSTVGRWAEKGELLEETEGEKTEIPVEIVDGLKKFCNAYKEAKEMQKEFLISIGLAGAAPAPFAIFTAKNVTDMRDKIETDITSKGEKLTITGMQFIKDGTPVQD